MAREATPPKSRRGGFRDWIVGVAIALGAVAASVLVAEIPAVRELAALIDRAPEAQPWLMGMAIGLTAVGGLVMLGAQFLPEPRQPPRPSDEALDGAAVPMEFAEQHSRWSSSMEMTASTEEVREAWHRRSWRYSPKWRMFFLMMLGALLLVLGLVSLFILIGPAFVKVLFAGAGAYLVVRILWEFAVR